MSDSLQRCPKCGTLVEAGANFCDACGAELRAEAVPAEFGAPSGGAAERSEAEGVSRTEAPASDPRAEQAEAAGGATVVAESVAAAQRPTPRAEDARGAGGRIDGSEAARPRTFFAPSLRADPSDAVPFVLEWDEAREFIEGQAGTFSFRVKALWDLAKIGVAATVNGEELPPAVFPGIRRGDSREGTFDFTPSKPGQVSVSLRAETVPRGLVHECFAAKRTLSHLVRTQDSRRYFGPNEVRQTISVDNRNDHGLSRNEQQRYSQNAGGETADNWKDQDRVLGRGGAFRPVEFEPGAVRRENALIRSSADEGLSELLVLPGTDLVTIGTSSHADAGLFVETADGYTDERHTGYVSGFHLSIQRDPKREAFVLRDGGPDRKAATRAAWRKSTNGVTVDGEDLRGELPLRPGAKLRVCLAPYAVSGGALPLEMEARGWDDPAAAGCEDRRGNLSSLLVRRRDNPRKAILVVWGAAALDPVLGTRTGLRVACAGGRLFLGRPDGGATRIHRLVGQPLAGTPFTIS